MRRANRWSRSTGAAAAAVALLALGCGDRTTSAGAGAADTATVRLAAEHVVTAEVGRVSSGPTISGQLTPARAATVRAQVGGSIVSLPFDRGLQVPGGAEVARVASRDLESAFESAQAAVTSAETTLALAITERNRTESLVTGGALAARDLDQARSAVANAEAQLAAARSRERSAWQQLDDTTIKAPFSGIVSARPASVGDVVQPGTELLTIIDPSSMRLEALVPSDQIQQVQRGAPALFTIRGIPGKFTGRVDRVSPAADPVTRQVSIFVTLPNTGGRLIAGLFAEGRLETASREGIVVPLSAVDETGPAPEVTRVQSGRAERVVVTLGPRQLDTETVEITGGVAPGDVLIVGSGKGIASGTPVEIVR